MGDGKGGRNTRSLVGSGDCKLFKDRKLIWFSTVLRLDNSAWIIGAQQRVIEQVKEYMFSNGWVVSILKGELGELSKLNLYA